jgi:hypothetical protein
LNPFASSDNEILLQNKNKYLISLSSTLDESRCMTLHKPKIVPFSHLFLIQTLASPDDPHSYFLNAIQQVVDTIIPESLWLEMKSGVDPETIFYRLTSLLPIFKHSELTDSSDSLTIIYLCPEEYTHNARRYVIDTLSKWLIPGKQVEIAGGISLNFQFVHNPSYRFLVAQEIISIRNEQENAAIRRNLSHLMAELKEKLPCEFLRQAENVVHPIFMPRNEEELIRNLIVLANQIRYVRDLPQVSIHYDKQTDADLNFTVIIARLLKGNIEPLRKILEKSSLKMDIDDVRVMGYLKQKYAKEAAILRVTVNKKPFFRADYSVDLLRARQKIVSQLSQCLGEFRDFNGGMILKQDEALGQLRQELGKLTRQKEFLLENYFYSLKPGVMQTVHDVSILKKHFELLSTVRKSDLRLQPYQIVCESMGKFFLCYIAATAPSFKEGVLNAIAPLEISSRDLTTSFLEMDDTAAMGFILRMESPEIAQQFQTAILQAFAEWSHRFYCPVK